MAIAESALMSVRPRGAESPSIRAEGASVARAPPRAEVPGAPRGDGFQVLDPPLGNEKRVRDLLDSDPFRTEERLEVTAP